MPICVAFRTITWLLVKQMRERLIPLFHGLHGRAALLGADGSNWYRRSHGCWRRRKAAMAPDILF